MKKYKIIECPRCHRIQIIGGKSLRCKFCNHTTKLKLKSELGLHLKIIKEFDSEREASQFINAYHKELTKNKFMGFEEYKMEKEEKEYWVGVCGNCRQDIMSNQDWDIEQGKPCHRKCPPEAERAIMEEDVF